MKQKYKALMLDLDGTTVQNGVGFLPSSEVTKAIKKAHKEISVCIVTGRSYSETKPLLDILNITDPSIVMGGAQIIDGISHKSIYERPLLEEDVAQILTVLTQYNVEIQIRERMKDIIYTSPYKAENPFVIYAQEMSEELADEIIHKLSHISTIAAHKFLSWNVGKFCLNISHVQATKQHGVFEVARRLHINTHEIIGVGDGPNDFPLLMACGLKIAIGNAVPDLKEIADYIAPTVDEDGVVDIIEKFILHS